MNKIKDVENYLKNLLFSGEITIEELENLSVRLRDELKQPKKKNTSSFSVNDTIYRYLCSINILRFPSRIIGWRW